MSDFSGYKNTVIICHRGLVLDSGFVRISEGKIVDVGPMSVSTDTSGLIDGRGLTVVPGLMDCHTHLSFPTGSDGFDRLREWGPARVALVAHANAIRTLHGGIVRVRDMGSPFGTDVEVRNFFREGLSQGPAIHASGRHIGPTGGQGWMFGVEADGPDEMVKAVRRELKHGADQIKIMGSGGAVTAGTDPSQRYLSAEEIRAVVETAHMRNKKVACHAHSNSAIETAVREGVDSIEHGSLASRDILAAMAQNGQFLVPTLSAPYKIISSPESKQLPQEMVNKTSQLFERQLQMIKEAKELGVRIACGSDAGSPLNHHGDNLSELRLLITHGLTVLEAIEAATETAAALLGITAKTGSVTVGKRGDLTVFRGDVLGDPLRVLQRENIDSVWIGGNRITLQQ